MPEIAEILMCTAEDSLRFANFIIAGDILTIPFKDKKPVGGLAASSRGRFWFYLCQTYYVKCYSACSYSKSDKKMNFSLSHILVKDILDQDMQISVMPPPWQTVTSSRREHASYSNKRARIEENSVSRLEKPIEKQSELINRQNKQVYSTNHPSGKAHSGTVIIVKSNIKHYELAPHKQDYFQAASVMIYDCHCPMAISEVKGEPTYWLTDVNKIPDFLDFFTAKHLSPRYIEIRSVFNLSADHSPISATINTTIIENNPPISLYNRLTNWDFFQETFNNAIETILLLKTTNDVDRAVNHLTHNTIDAVGASTPSLDYKSGYDYFSNILNKIAEKRKLRRN
ncbi:hypothetical protein M0802_011315 [Mischocyttarus mexicanus]|nr:hypothetical protein M0802_011315 [Mischocyttarus mexicanus]